MKQNQECNAASKLLFNSCVTRTDFSGFTTSHFFDLKVITRLHDRKERQSGFIVCFDTVIDHGVSAETAFKTRWRKLQCCFGIYKFSKETRRILDLQTSWFFPFDLPLDLSPGLYLPDKKICKRKSDIFECAQDWLFREDNMFMHFTHTQSLYSLPGEKKLNPSLCIVIIAQVYIMNLNPKM